VIDEIVNGYLYDTQGRATNYTFHHDQIQSVVGVSGHAGSVEEAVYFAPFGEERGGSGASPNLLRYTGRQLDPETGLYYYRARYYDPDLGRFLSEDPLGFGSGINFYAYVGNNPVNRNDPTGLIDVIFGAGGSAVAPTGVEGSGGIFFGFDNETGQAEGGLFGAIGAGVGVNVSADVFVGIVDDVNGQTINQNFTVGPVSVSLFFDANEGGLVGGTLGWGPGATVIGGSTTSSVGAGFDVIGAVRDAVGSFFGSEGGGGVSSPGSAAGGFVLYPSRPNLNSVAAVYDK
jgi:RHS repeat-associated protein